MDRIHLIRFTGKCKKDDKELDCLGDIGFEIMESYREKYDTNNKHNIGFVKFMEIDSDDGNVYYNSFFSYKANQYDDIIFHNLSEIIKDKLDIIEIIKQEI